MRRSEKAIADRAKLEQILLRGEVCRIGLSVNNQPYVVPVNFAFSGGSIFFHSAREGRKIDMIRQNPQASFEVTGEYAIVAAEDACGWGAAYRSVMGSGTAALVTEKDECAKALDLLMAKYSGRNGWEFNSAALDRTLVVRLDIEEMTGKQSGMDQRPSGGHRFSAPSEIIEEAIARLKNHGNVAPDARYNSSAREGLRREIAYHDEDLLWYLGKSPMETRYVDAAVNYLAEFGLVPDDFSFQEQRYLRYRGLIKQNFRGGWTSFTPVMERLLYTLCEIKRPARMLELGCFWGNTLSWFAGPALGRDKIYQAEEIVGVDIDEPMIWKARENFAAIGADHDATLIVDDARNFIRTNSRPVDFLYLEAKVEGEPSIYLELLEEIYDQLPKGTWVIAHDIYDKDDISEIRPYTEWVRDPGNFSTSIAFDIDSCGLELSIK